MSYSQDVLDAAQLLIDSAGSVAAAHAAIDHISQSDKPESKPESSPAPKKTPPSPVKADWYFDAESMDWVLGSYRVYQTPLGQYKIRGISQSFSSCLAAQKYVESLLSDKPVKAESKPDNKPTPPSPRGRKTRKPSPVAEKPEPKAEPKTETVEEFSAPTERVDHMLKRQTERATGQPVQLKTATPKSDGKGSVSVEEILHLIDRARENGQPTVAGRLRHVLDELEPGLGETLNTQLAA